MTAFSTATDLLTQVDVTLQAIGDLRDSLGAETKLVGLQALEQPVFATEQALLEAKAALEKLLADNPEDPDLSAGVASSGTGTDMDA